MTSLMASDGVTLFYACKTLQIHVNECDIVYVMIGVLQCNSGKLEEPENFKCVFVVYCVLESKYISSSA